jgi:hypothetical protein
MPPQQPDNGRSERDGQRPRYILEHEENDVMRAFEVIG